MITHKLTHASEMLANLMEQYKNRPVWAALIGSVLAPQIQDLEDALFEITADLDLTNSVGSQLDGIGRIVNQPRNGQTDAVYRNYLTAKMMSNRSTGTLQELIVILELLIGGSPTMTILEPPDTDPATIEINMTSALSGTEDGFVIGSLVFQAKDAGVHFLFTFFHAPVFRFDVVGAGFDRTNGFAGTAGG